MLSYSLCLAYILKRTRQYSRFHFSKYTSLYHEVFRSYISLNTYHRSEKFLFLSHVWGSFQNRLHISVLYVLNELHGHALYHSAMYQYNYHLCQISTCLSHVWHRETILLHTLHHFSNKKFLCRFFYFSWIFRQIYPDWWFRILTLFHYFSIFLQILDFYWRKFPTHTSSSLHNTRNIEMLTMIYHHKPLWNFYAEKDHQP